MDKEATYRRTYEDSTIPQLSDLIGKWKVTVLSGKLPDFSHFGHVKVIKQVSREVLGFNRVLYFFKGLQFHITLSQSSAYFEYDDYDFVDKVRKIDQNTMIGMYESKECEELLGKSAGWFRMDRL